MITKMDKRFKKTGAVKERVWVKRRIGEQTLFPYLPLTHFL